MMQDDIQSVSYLSAHVTSCVHLPDQNRKATVDIPLLAPDHTYRCESDLKVLKLVLLNQVFSSCASWCFVADVQLVKLLSLCYVISEGEEEDKTNLKPLWCC